jgi:small subunit ribosomal protein S6
VRRYETIFVLRPDLGEGPLRQSIKRIEDIVGHGGELIETDEWGVRELAYNIKRERRGYYVRLDYVAPGPVMNEVERNLKLMDQVLRYLSVMVEEEADAAQLRSEIEARQRRLAEARSAEAAAAAARAQPESAEVPESAQAPEAPAEPAGEPAQAEPQPASENGPEQN